MRAVNLLPRENSSSTGADRVVVAAVAITAVVAAIVAGAFFIEQANASSERQHAATVQAELAQARSQQPIMPSRAPAQLQVPVVLSQTQPWHVALDSALSTRVAWDVLLKQLEYVVPDRITINSASLGGAGATAGPASGAITLGGNAFSAHDIAVFLSTLARIPHISQVALVSSSANASSGKPLVAFQITAQMDVPAPPAPPVTDTTATTTTGGH